jgi:hypothetical protein
MILDVSIRQSATQAEVDVPGRIVGNPEVKHVPRFKNRPPGLDDLI